MKCRLHNPNHDLKSYWVDWSRLQPLWERNTFHPLSPSKLTRAYHALWFADIDGPRSHFKIGAIWHQQQSGALMFTNGRHRTLLLSTLTERIPLAIDDDALQQQDVTRALLDPVKSSDILELPPLPVLERSAFGWERKR